MAESSIKRLEDARYYYLFSKDDRIVSLRIIDKEEPNFSLAFNYGEDITFIADDCKQWQGFKIDSQSPIYTALKTFLGSEKSLIILDDNANFTPVCMPAIKFSDEGLEIKIEFLNPEFINDGTILVKNIFPDLRSYIDMMKQDTKSRLATLFSEIRNIFNQKELVRK